MALQVFLGIFAMTFPAAGWPGTWELAGSN
jgi:hypothetical protein